MLISVAHGAKDIFQSMAQGLQLREPEKTAGALDGMD